MCYWTFPLVCRRVSRDVTEEGKLETEFLLYKAGLLGLVQIFRDLSLDEFVKEL